MTTKQLAMQISRELRKNQTTAEKVFWMKIRNKQIRGYKFLRQHPIFYHWQGKEKFFIADFYCKELKLVVEIDGGVHIEQKDYDRIRSEVFEIQRELRVMRFSNKDILNNIKKVLEELYAII
ncbi:MAG: endonuclease domain-containing protein [Calditrichaceae bacterium]|nr:endonuclease domain-containing protein [Calditrichaceae bacterium]